MLLSGSSKGASTEKFLCQNVHYKTKTFTELINEHFIKFEKKIDGYFSSLV